MHFDDIKPFIRSTSTQFGILVRACIVVLVALSFSVTINRSAQAADAIQKYGNWGVFVESEPSPKTCWAATTLHSDSGDSGQILLAVTISSRRSNPAVSIFSNKRLPKSAGIYLSVSGQEYRMRSDGQHAWPSNKKTDKKIVAAMIKIASSSKASDRLVYAGRKGGVRISIRIDGFGAALDRLKRECSRA